MARSRWRCQTPDCRTILGYVRENGSLYLDEDRDLVIDLKADRCYVVCPTCDEPRLYTAGTVHNLVRRKRLLRLSALSQDQQPRCFRRRGGEALALHADGNWKVRESVGIVTYSPELFDALYEPTT